MVTTKQKTIDEYIAISFTFARVECMYGAIRLTSIPEKERRGEFADYQELMENGELKKTLEEKIKEKARFPQWYEGYEPNEARALRAASRAIRRGVREYANAFWEHYIATEALTQYELNAPNPVVYACTGAIIAFIFLGYLYRGTPPEEQNIDLNGTVLFAGLIGGYIISEILYRSRKRAHINQERQAEAQLQNIEQRIKRVAREAYEREVAQQ